LPVSITKAKVMVVWNFAKIYTNFSLWTLLNTTTMTLTTTHTHWNINTAMVVLKRTITSQNNAHQLQPHLTQHITKQHTHTKHNTTQNNTENNFDWKRWSSATTPNLIEVEPDQVKHENNNIFRIGLKIIS